MAYELIKVEETFEGEVTEITLGPPPANIVSAKLMEEVSAQLKDEESKKNKKLIIFKSEGKHFSFGASVEEHKPGEVNSMLPKFHSFIGEIINCKVTDILRTIRIFNTICAGRELFS